MSPTVSVVMAVYNGMPYLEAAVQSILTQTLSDFELIAINDASTDDSLNYLESCQDARLTIINLPENGGQTHALNVGLRAASGRYIARQDADDLSAPDRLGRQVEFLEAHPDHILLGTGIAFIDAQGQTIGYEERPQDDTAIRHIINIENDNPIAHGSVMFRRVVLEQAGYYREGFRNSQDLDYWLRMMEHGKAANLPMPAPYLYRTHPGQMSYTSFYRMKDERDLILELHAARQNGQDDAELYEQGIAALNATYHNFQPTASQKRRIQGEIWRNKGSFALRQNRYFVALYNLARAFLVDPANPRFWRALRNRLT